MTKMYFEILADYIGTISWFVVLIAAKLSHINVRKKLTKGEVFMNIIYCIVGGMFAYYGTISFQKNFRFIAMGLGVLSGDILVSWIVDNVKSYLDLAGSGVKAIINKWTKNKK